MYTHSSPICFRSHVIGGKPIAIIIIGYNIKIDLSIYDILATFCRECNLITLVVFSLAVPSNVKSCLDNMKSETQMSDDRPGLA